MARLLPVRALVLGAIALCASACGGGGGGDSIPPPPAKETVTGHVIDVKSGGGPSPAATITGGGGSSTSAATTGLFTLQVAPGTSSLTVDTHSASGVWVFSEPPINSSGDIGSLYVGSQRVQVKGIVQNASGQPVSGATVKFENSTATTAANGAFTLSNVAYSSTSTAFFSTIQGTVSGAGLADTTFTAGSNTAVNGVVNVGTIKAAGSDTNPPSVPFNMWGHVSPLQNASGTVVTLVSNGQAVRSFTVGSDGVYWFWVFPGSYTINFVKGNLKATATATLASTSQVIQRDVTLQ